MRRRFGLVGACLALLLPARALAGGMDPALSRLSYAGGNGPCAGGPVGQRPPICPDNESFEHLATELAGTLALAADQGAATVGARGFYLGLSSTMTTIRGDSRYWSRGTRGTDPTAVRNVDVDSLLVWNRLDVRKGLPFGFEVGSSVGFGMDTSLWVLSAQLKLALFEGYRTGLGALPDIALRAGTQALVGSSELSVSTQNLDITLSKPFVVLQQHIVTPLIALQLLFVSARSGVIDLSPGTNSFDACAPATSRGNGVALDCTQAGGAAELANNASFRTVNQTRVRLFLGAEERYQLLSITASMGFDLTTPRLQNETPGEMLPKDLMRQFSVHVACGLRY